MRRILILFTDDIHEIVLDITWRPLVVLHAFKNYLIQITSNISTLFYYIIRYLSIKLITVLVNVCHGYQGNDAESCTFRNAVTLLKYKFSPQVLGRKISIEFV